MLKSFANYRRYHIKFLENSLGRPCYTGHLSSHKESLFAARMYLCVLGRSGRSLAPFSPQRYLQTCSVGSLLLSGYLDFYPRPLIGTSLLYQHNKSFRKQYPKLCSSSYRENAANQSSLNMMKDKLNQYASVLNKNNFTSITSLTSNVILSSKGLLRTIRDDVADLKSCPMPPLILGFGGLIPFVAAPAHFIMSAAFAPGVAFGQLAYGAVILSFIGGIRWGVSLDEPKWENLVGSIVPSLVGWSSLLVPHWFGCCLVCAGLISAVSTDRSHPKYQPWFRSLRVALTTIAVISLCSSLLLGLVLPVSKK